MIYHLLEGLSSSPDFIFKSWFHFWYA